MSRETGTDLLFFTTLKLWHITPVLALALDNPRRTFAPMARISVDTDEQKLLGRALGVLRARREISQDSAGEAYGITGEGWRKYEAGLAKSIFSPDTQSRLAKALRFTREDLLEERARLAGEDLPLRTHASPGDRQTWMATRAGEPSPLPIRDSVQAGAWLVADDSRQDGPATYPATRDPRFAQAEQWLSEVRGDSMNMLNIVEGDLVHCVDAIAIGYYPRTGDVVEVERARFGGQERELTLKQVEVSADGVRLWPRSTNPRFRTPIELHAGVGETEDIEVRIRALVTASIRRL